MKKYIYIHTPFLDGWEEVYTDILSFIKEEDKKDVISIVLGGKQHDSLLNPIFLKYPVEYNECATLQMMWNHASFIKEKALFYYVHLKGITRRGNDKINSFGWRKFMCHFLFNDMKKNEDILKTHDCLGSLFFAPPNPHYSGNFWACTSEHLKKLPYPAYNQNRLIFEMWVACISGKYYNHHPNTINRYNQYQDHTQIDPNIQPETIEY